MATIDEIKAECRLYAVEWLATLMFAAQFRQAGPAGPAFLAQVRSQALEGARQKTFPTLDPAMSDLVSGEIEVAVDRILGMATEFLAKAPSEKK